MKIILATDGSTGADAALEEVARGNYPPDSQVRIVSAVNYESPLIGEPSGLTREYFLELEREAQRQGQKIVEKARTKLSELNPNVKISTVVLVGSPKRAIVEEAERWQPDLIVVGSHGLSRWERAFIGSVSQSVAAHAPCSVKIVRKNAG